MQRIDFNYGAHAGTQRRLIRAIKQLELDRDALDDLDPVASRILWRQQREFRAGRHADALHFGAPDMGRVAVDLNDRILANLYMREVGFLEVGFHPDIVGSDD